VKVVLNSWLIKHSFTLVKKVNTLLSKIDKIKKNKGAKQVRNFKRCAYNMENTFRQAVNNAVTTQGKGFLDILPQEETIEVVSLHKSLNPEDFDSPLFNSIMAHKHSVGLNAQLSSMSLT